MLIHVLLYEAGKETEGIHSLEIKGKTVVLMFENKEDAERYSVLLEAQDFPMPSVESIDRQEIEKFCNEAGYKARFIEKGFLPKTEEERMFLSPPVSNRDVVNWDKDDEITEKDQFVSESSKDLDLDAFRKRLEGLI